MPATGQAAPVAPKLNLEGVTAESYSSDPVSKITLKNAPALELDVDAPAPAPAPAPAFLPRELRELELTKRGPVFNEKGIIVTRGVVTGERSKDVTAYIEGQKEKGKNVEGQREVKNLKRIHRETET
jgi:hypothetical protein